MLYILVNAIFYISMHKYAFKKKQGVNPAFIEIYYFIISPILL